LASSKEKPLLYLKRLRSPKLLLMSNDHELRKAGVSVISPLDE
jgi:hypothetical protein